MYLKFDMTKNIYLWTNRNPVAKSWPMETKEKCDIQKFNIYNLNNKIIDS